MIVFTLLAASVLFLFQFVAFGLLLTDKLPYKLNALESVIISTFISAAIFASVFFMGGHILGVQVYFFSLIPLAIGLYNYRQLFTTIKQLLKAANANKVFSLLATIAIVSLYATLALSWVMSNGDLVIQAGQLHDSAWHIALIQKLMVAIPPEHPSDFTEIVVNYHYFYDLLIANFAKVYRLDVTSLYFQFFPLILSGLLAGTAFAVGSKLMNKLTATYLVFLTFFAGSFAYLIPLFYPVILGMSPVFG